MEPSNQILKEVAELFFSVWKDDGRFKLYPEGGIYPCHTAHAVNLLCNMGYTFDERIQKTLQHLVEIRHIDNGLRCNKFSFGKGPETESSNPFSTLIAMNAFRFNGYVYDESYVDGAVEFLLNHWTIRKPIGPYHYGMGTLFMQV